MNEYSCKSYKNGAADYISNHLILKKFVGYYGALQISELIVSTSKI
jgi:hypothetical protein